MAVRSVLPRLAPGLSASPLHLIIPFRVFARLRHFYPHFAFGVSPPIGVPTPFQGSADARESTKPLPKPKSPNPQSSPRPHPPSHGSDQQRHARGHRTRPAPARTDAHHHRRSHVRRLGAPLPLPQPDGRHPDGGGDSHRPWDLVRPGDPVRLGDREAGLRARVCALCSREALAPAPGSGPASPRIAPAVTMATTQKGIGGPVVAPRGFVFRHEDRDRGGSALCARATVAGESPHRHRHRGRRTASSAERGKPRRISPLPPNGPPG